VREEFVTCTSTTTTTPRRHILIFISIVLASTIPFADG
jgi:hypothetical protein